MLELERRLRERVDGEVRFDATARAAYSTDASNFRRIPLGVVTPRTVEAGVAAIAVCREFDAPVLSRGGGTSLAGQGTNTAVIIDWSKHCHRLVAVDTDQRTCVVEPGIVLDTLNQQLRDYGLEFGPRPATHSRCAIGGMIGNNSCGASSQRVGKVDDNVERLEILLYDGTRMWVGKTSDEEYQRIVAAGGRKAEVYQRLRYLRDDVAPLIRARYPDIPRRVSGYNLDALLPERGFHVARALVGAEGTLVTVLRAELKLVPVVPATSLVILGFPEVAAAADAVPAILPSHPTALEGMESGLTSTNLASDRAESTESLFAEGEGLLLVQMGGETATEASERAERLVTALGRTVDAPDVRCWHDPVAQARVWRAREAAVGTATRSGSAPAACPGWEDSAVPPENLGGYLRDLRALLTEYGYGSAQLYGHFGQGCVHTRIPFDLAAPAGVARYRSFLERAADLVVSYGGSLSGEHGDGQQRGELLPKMFGGELIAAFERYKAIFDPGGRMNPGMITQPLRLDQDLRLGADYHPAPTDTRFSYPEDAGDFASAVLRCVGVGECRRPSGGLMCPSYQVTRDEEHSTRGRARLLFEMLDGTARGGVVAGGWRSEAVLEALDLCLACKGCKAECPVNVDLATYKAEFLSHHYSGRPRPRDHYSMGWLPVWAALASLAPRLVNATTQAPGLRAVVKAVAGVDRRRELPRFASTTFQQWFRDRPASGDGSLGEVLLWPDTFTNHFDPSVGIAAVRVLEAAGWRVLVPTEKVCCGLTWISTGQLATARKVLSRTVAILRDHLRSGGLIVGLEPSCLAVFRDDAANLLPGDEDVARLARQTFTLGELLWERTEGWRPPTITSRILVQRHCHQQAVLGFAAEAALLRATGASVRILDSGCCGLAGNFGFTRGHYEVSMACAERVLFPEVRAAEPGDVVLADGFSCRTQLAQGNLGGRRGTHLAQLLATERPRRSP